MPKLNEILGEYFKQIPEDIKNKYKDIDLVDISNYVEKKDLDTANNSIKEYKKQLKDRDKQLNDLKDKAEDSEGLLQEIEKLKKDNEKSTKDYEDKLNQINFDTKFEKAIAGYKAKNPKTLKGLLDMDKVKLVDDTFIGLDEQVKILKESDSYLFNEESSGGTGNLGGADNSIMDDKTESLGARLAKERVESAKTIEIQDKFFG